ncbi:MAG: DUF1104 domain-containing protein [Campylobacteraceae bacterium]|nr:DUF1104 domain-containing protein [Campylobacteraceae bacterium]
MGKTVAFLLSLSLAFAGANFSSMSNEELIALIGYIKPSEQAEYNRILKMREDSFTPKEKVQLEKNRKKAKK